MPKPIPPLIFEQQNISPKAVGAPPARTAQSRVCSQGCGSPGWTRQCSLCHRTRSALAAPEGSAEASRAGFGGKGLAEPGSSTLSSNLVHKDITRRYKP